MKRVSAIITTHNRKLLLKRAVTSVFSQSYSNIELIVVDDHSSDGTKEYCKSLPKIHYIYIPKEESIGGNYARNQGVKIASGEYIAFLDDDDYWLPTKIEKQVILMEKDHCGLVYCGYMKEIVNSHKVKLSPVLPLLGSQGDMSRKILMTIPTTTSNILVSKKVLDKARGFDEKLRFWQEYELLIRLAQFTSFGIVYEPLSVYRIDYDDTGRLTNKYESWRTAVKYIHEKHKDLYCKLSAIEKLYVKTLVWNDAIKRCNASGNIILQIKYTLLSFPIRSYSKTKRILASIFSHNCQ